jgi:branched-chain amino acid transport system permease protein
VVSRFGRVLRGAKENPVRMEAIGLHPFRFQLMAYTISGMIAGLAGVLLANQAEFISPATMSWQRSGELIFIVVLGGLGSLHGAILGAAAFLLLEEFLPGLTEHWKMLFGPMLILVVLFARGGIASVLQRGRDA